MEAERLRIVALLDLLCRGKSEVGSSLASYLGLPEQPKRSRPRKEGGPLTWPDLVAQYRSDFKARSLARERNLSKTLRRLDLIASAFGGRPDHITARDWASWLSSLPTGIPSRNKLPSMVGRVYRYGISSFMCRINPMADLLPQREPDLRAARRYRTLLAMIEREMAMSNWSEKQKADMLRRRVLDEGEQAGLVEILEGNGPLEACAAGARLTAASSAESVVVFWFGQSRKCVI